MSAAGTDPVELNDTRRERIKLGAKDVKVLCDMGFDKDCKINSTKDFLNSIHILFENHVKWSQVNKFWASAMDLLNESSLLIVREWSKMWYNNANSARYSSYLAAYYLNTLASAIHFQDFLQSILKFGNDEFGKIFVISINDLLNATLASDHSGRCLKTTKSVKSILSAPGMYTRITEFVLNNLSSMQLLKWSNFLNFLFVHAISKSLSHSNNIAYSEVEQSVFCQYKNQLLLSYKNLLCDRLYGSEDVFCSVLKYGLTWQEFSTKLLLPIQDTLLKSSDSLSSISKIFRVVSNFDSKHAKISQGVACNDLKWLEISALSRLIEYKSIKFLLWLLNKIYAPLHESSLKLGPVVAVIADSIIEYSCNKSDLMRDQARVITSSLVLDASAEELALLLSKIDSLLSKWQTNEFCRQGLYNCLDSIGRFAPEVAQTLIDRYIPQIPKLVEMERRKENFSILHSMLGTWIALDPNRIFKFDCVSNLFLKGFKSDNTQFYLTSIYKSVSHVTSKFSNECSTLTSEPMEFNFCSIDLGSAITNELISFVQSSNVKIVLRIEACLSFVILLSSSAFKAEQMWPLIINSNSFLNYNPRLMLAKASTNLGLDLSHVIPTIIQAGMIRFDMYESTSMLWKVLMRYLDSDVSLRDSSAFLRCMRCMAASKNGPKIISIFLKNCLQMLESSSRSNNDRGHAKRRILNQLVGIVSGFETGTVVEDFGRLLILRFHPAVTPKLSKRKFRIFTENLKIDERSIVEQHGSEIFQFLMEYSLNNQCSKLCISARRSIVYLSRYAVIEELIVTSVTQHLLTTSSVSQFIEISRKPLGHEIDNTTLHGDAGASSETVESNDTSQKSIFKQIETALSIMNLLSSYNSNIFESHSLTLMYESWVEVINLARSKNSFTNEAINVVQNVVNRMFTLKSEVKVISMLINIPDRVSSEAFVEKIQSLKLSALDWSIIQQIIIDAMSYYCRDPECVEQKAGFTSETVRVVFEILYAHSNNVNRHLLEAMMEFVEGGFLMWECVAAALVEHASDWCVSNAEHRRAIDVLFRYLYSPETRARGMVLSVLMANGEIIKAALQEQAILALFFAGFDADDSNAEMVESLSRTYHVGLSVPKSFYSTYERYLSSSDQNLREMAGRSIAAAMDVHRDSALQMATIKLLIQKFESHFWYVVDAGRRPFSTNNRGPPRENESWIWTRRGVVCVFLHLYLVKVSQAAIGRFFSFAIETALLDQQTYDDLLQAGVSIIDSHGATFLDFLYNRFNTFLSNNSSMKHGSCVHEAVAIWAGSMAQYLPEGDSRFESTTEQLLVVINTPSESMRITVSQCLSRIVKRITNLETLLKRCLDMALQPSGDYVTRRSGAWALAGLIGGIGACALRRWPFIIDDIRHALSKSSAVGPAGGACAVCECLNATLQEGFEPWLITLLKRLIGLFTASVELGDIAYDALRVILSRISPLGIRAVLMRLFACVDSFSNRWKARVRTIELLSVVFENRSTGVAPCLPTFIPRLLTLFNDSHTEVQRASRAALNSLGNAVSGGPELSNVVYKLLSATMDFDAHGASALQAFEEVRLFSRIDGVTLALLVPILRRAFTEKVFETRLCAMQILAGICDIVAQRDLNLYYEELYSSLMTLLGDAVPEIRYHAAVSLARLVSQRGCTEETIRNLMQRALSDPVYVDRMGAAQALAHLALYLDLNQVQKLVLEPIESGCKEIGSIITRQGCMLIIRFLPESLAVSVFETYLEPLLSCVICTLSDEQEFVRETALTSGRAIMKRFAHERLDLLVPILERAMCDLQWRVRAGAVQLLENVLLNASGSGSNGEDLNNAVLQMSETPSRQRILVCLFMLRHDPGEHVSSHALACWKSAISNTGRLLKLLSNVALELIFEHLDGHETQRMVAAKSLADLVSRLGDYLLARIFPSLSQLLTSQSIEARRGVCMCVCELLPICNFSSRNTYVRDIMDIVSTALCDLDEVVRADAGRVFERLSAMNDVRAIDAVLPRLLARIEAGDGERTLPGFSLILRNRAAVILPHLIRDFLKPPITAFGAKALASVIEAAGSEASAFIPSTFPVLMRTAFQQSFYSCESTECVLRALQALMLTVSSPSSMENLASEWRKWAADSSPILRVQTQRLVSWFVYNKRLFNHDGSKRVTVGSNEGVVSSDPWCPSYWYENIDKVIWTTFGSYNDPEREVVEESVQATRAVLSTVNSEVLSASKSSIVQVLNDVFDVLRTEKTINGLLLNGVDSLITVYITSLRVGSKEMKLQSCVGLTYIAQHTPELSTAALQSMFGPLIRVLSEQNLDMEVRSRVTNTLNSIIDNGGSKLRAFAYTLQVLFLKALYFTDATVLDQTCLVLSRLPALGAKPDYLVTSLLSVLGDENALFKSVLQALALTMKNLQIPLSQNTEKCVIDAMRQYLCDSNATVRQYVSTIITGVLASSSVDEFVETFRDLFVSNFDNFNDESNQTALLVLYETFSRPHACSSQIAEALDVRQVASTLLTHSKTTAVRTAAARVIGTLLSINGGVDDFQLAQTLTAPLTNVEDDDIDLTHAILSSIKKFAKSHTSSSLEYLACFVHPILEKIKKGTIFNVQYEAARALYHLLHLDSSNIYLTFAESLPPTLKKNFLLLCKKLTTSNFVDIELSAPH